MPNCNEVFFGGIRDIGNFKVAHFPCGYGCLELLKRENRVLKPEDIAW